MVALVGKNGAGKSRILEFVKDYINTITPNNFFDEHITLLPQTIISPFSQNIANAKIQFTALKRNNLTQQNEVQYRNSLNANLAPVITKIKQFGPAYIKIVDNDDLKKIKTNVNNNSKLTFEEILSNSHFENFITNTIKSEQNPRVPQETNPSYLNEFTAFNHESTIEYLKKLSTTIITDEFSLYIKNRDNPQKIKDEIKDKNAFILFSKFQDYVHQFLGKGFSYRESTKGNVVDSILYYNDTPFNLSQFSPGQKTLFAYAILFFYLDINSKTNIKDSVIIIDEPEKHLHPEAQIKLLNAIKNIIYKSGQLWIATHSINILAHLEYDEIIMVKDDEIILPSRITPEKSFMDLMGIDNHIYQLTSFINSISDWAYGNFMVQCFKEPDVIFDKNTQDPQFKLFKEFLSNKEIIHLLDYGAGKGRIGYTISEDEMVSKKIKYSAFEPDVKNHEILKKVPDLVHMYSINSEILNHTFDAIILCNVLHEINPKEWPEILKNIRDKMHDNGYLIFIEDRFLPKGEKAHEFGYLILGVDEMRTLLNVDKPIELKLNEVEFRDRIIFNAFHKSQINPSLESTINAIELLNFNSLKNIRILREEKNDLNQGRRYANETQLFINSLLALEALKEEKLD